MDHQTAERLKALWKSGRDKYQSFFAVLKEVQNEVGDAALADWCRRELHIGISVITNTANVLIKTEADQVKEKLSAANKLERERIKAEREAEAEERRKRIVSKQRREQFTLGPKVDKARLIVRPMVEADEPMNYVELGIKYNMSHITFEKAAAIERARIEAIEEFHFNGKGV